MTDKILEDKIFRNLLSDTRFPYIKWCKKVNLRTIGISLWTPNKPVTEEILAALSQMLQEAS